MCFVMCGDLQKKAKRKLIKSELNEIKARAFGKLFSEIVKKNKRYYDRASRG